MGKKSRKKREARIQKDGIMGAPALPKDLLEIFGKNINYENVEADFQRYVSATRAVLLPYHPLDAALAIAVSDLWPANVASPIKHIFAWSALVNIGPSGMGTKRISSYGDFSTFIAALYAVWPDFPMLEDFLPEADWGQIRGRLGDEFVPMFYGSCIERTPDFIEAFRITQADNYAALADMDLAVAIQSYVIKNVAEFVQFPASNIGGGYVEVPPEEFWQQCRITLLNAETKLADWRKKSSGRLEGKYGVIKAPLGRNEFGDACMQGQALPVNGLIFQDFWLPIGVRSIPSNVIETWAEEGDKSASSSTHIDLSEFLQERFRGVIAGPLTVVTKKRELKLPISCVLYSGPRVYLLVSCSQVEISTAEKGALEILSTLREGEMWGLKHPDGHHSLVANKKGQSPTSQNIEIVLITTQSSTAAAFFDAPKKPIRLMPMSDLITIFDSIDDLDEFDRFWIFVSEQNNKLGPFSSSADLFASFRDTHEVLVDGAVQYSYISLDPHWGTSWRYRELSAFWADAPQRFPDGTSGWFVSKTAKGISELRSRHQSVLAYSVQVENCTVQALMDIPHGMRHIDAKMLDLFIQVISDCLQECHNIVSKLPLFGHTHIILRCEADPAYTLDDSESLETPFANSTVVTVHQKTFDAPLTIILRINLVAVSAGLLDSKDASFEVECLIEALGALSLACSEVIPDDILLKLRASANRPARHQLKISPRMIDVPDYADPIVPSSTEYKLARRQVAISILKLGLMPGRYELKEAKEKIDAARDQLRSYIEERLKVFKKQELVRCCIEQHDSLLSAERMKVFRVRQSLSHEVDYNRLEAIADARKELGTPARHYRYLLEKTISSTEHGGAQSVNSGTLRELIGLIDWYMVLASASDVLHNEVDVGGVEIDDSYIPEIFYSNDSKNRESAYMQEYARARLGLGVTDKDLVEGDYASLLENDDLRDAFQDELGFELRHLLQSLIILSQPVRHGISGDLAFSYSATIKEIQEAIKDGLEDITENEVAAIVQFLTLSAQDIRRLPDRNIDESDVPFWEHNKRLHRYTIRPLIPEGHHLRWGAEHSSRAMNIWMGAVRDGYLPADFSWPRVGPAIRKIKKSIENQLEIKTEQICLRFTPHVVRGADFFRRFPAEGFEDVGDFDVLAYWPETNSILAIECKYNKPPYAIKDSRRLRDSIFGKHENDKAGQFSRIARRRNFIAMNRARMINLMRWPMPASSEQGNYELYVSREVHWWMVHPPYPVPTIFTRVDSLDSWLRSQQWSYQSDI